MLEGLTATLEFFKKLEKFKKIHNGTKCCAFLWFSSIFKLFCAFEKYIFFNIWPCGIKGNHVRNSPRVGHFLSEI